MLSQTASFKMNTIKLTVQNIRIAGTDNAKDNKPAIIFLHGSSQSHKVWYLFHQENKRTDEAIA